MPRQADPQKNGAIQDLVKAMRGNGDLTLVRLKYHNVAKQTWSRWIAEARDIAASGKKFKPVPIENNKLNKNPPDLTPKRGRGRPAGSKKKPPQEGQLLDRPAAGAGGSDLGGEALRGGSGPDEGQASYGRITDDGQLYYISTMFGPKEFGITRRFTAPPELDPHKALGILDRMGEQYLNAEAMMRANLKPVGDGHVILDSGAYGAAVDLQRKVLMDMLKILERSRNLDSIQTFIGAIVAQLQKHDPKMAVAVIKIIREAAQPFSSRSWPSTPQPIS